MSRLVLVRHGQASFGSADYDRLSPLGELQARRVGERLAREHDSLHSVRCGPRRRHLRTAELAVEAARAAGAHCPDPIVDENLDELPVRELVLANGLGADLLDSLVRAIERWARGELLPPGVLTPAAFVARVEAVLRASLPPEGEAAVLVTSGGPIAVGLMRSQPHLDVGAALSRSQELANASWTVLDRQLARIVCEPVAHLEPHQITRV